ncbi:RDD family protein [Georgenia sp. 10Sc9-8]|uniref:RDD family protein n=1 Tax=Georgenia halotolerans TaxID=3028317 RepID=A0ABT5TZK4_9MICO|nr:RDD family protein [Georgenia halotolerans]
MSNPYPPNHDDSGTSPGYGQDPRGPSSAPQQPYGQPPATPPPSEPPYGQDGYGPQNPGAMPPPQQYGGYAPMGGPGYGQPADVMPRFLARLLDFLIVGITYGIVVSFIIVGLIMGTSDAGTVGMMGGGDLGAVDVVSTILSALVLLAYFSLMESYIGRTLGKMIMKLEVRGADGGRPTLGEAVRRNAWTALGIVGIVPFVGWLLSWVLQLAAAVAIAVTVSNDTVTRQGWHDRFADGTTVVRAG